jgi:ribosomal protein L19
VERIYQLYSPLIQNIKVGVTPAYSVMPRVTRRFQQLLQKNFVHRGQKRVRPSKLYYLRDLPARASTVT